MLSRFFGYSTFYFFLLFLFRLAVRHSGLRQLEERHKKLKAHTEILESEKQRLENDLYALNDKLSTTSRLNNSYPLFL
jgi:hypothetical protein